MKKIVRILGCLALGAVVLTSCVKNEESDSVKAIREATADKIEQEAREMEIANDFEKLDYEVRASIQNLELQIAKAKKEVELYEVTEGAANENILFIQGELADITAEVDAISEELYGSAGTPGGLVVTIASITKAINDQKEVVNNAADDDKPLEQAKLTSLNNQKTQAQAKIDSKVSELEALQKRMKELTDKIAKM